LTRVSWSFQCKNIASPDIHVLVKVRFQDPATASKYSSTTNALSTIIKEERISGLYKGVTAPMVCWTVHAYISTQLDLLQLGCAILNGIAFGTYGFFMKAQLQNDQKEPNLSQVFIAGAGSGVVSS
jgi:solute carrier family 25 (mitochondrial carnitine/acylcarnitine transporter), member 20/29